jgi:alpha-L-rhamnosidase
LDNQGFFRCSDPAISEIWDLGAYALETNQVPAGSLPPTFTSTREGLNVKGSTFCVYQAGNTWTNYTVTFDVQVVANETGWMVNTDPVFGYRFVLSANNNTAGPPNTLRLTIPFSSGTLAQGAPSLRS